MTQTAIDTDKDNYLNGRFILRLSAVRYEWRNPIFYTMEPAKYRDQPRKVATALRRRDRRRAKREART